ncbi:MAG TPA: hypothetical protein VFZ77_18955 [Acidimicrobiales bacterium]
MRTTITLEPDAEALVKRAMRERGLSFEQAVNLAIRRGLGPTLEGQQQRTPTGRRRITSRPERGSTRHSTAARPSASR